MTEVKHDGAQAMPLNKACEPCRSLKVRCIVPEDAPSCQRCIKYNRNCVFAPQHRKPTRKRNDTRIAQLEREIQSMRQLLNSSGQQKRPDIHDDNAAAAMPPDATIKTSSSRYSSPRHSSQSPTSGADMTCNMVSGAQSESRLSISSTATGDVIDRGVFSIETATELFESFKTYFLTKVAIFPFPADYTVHQLRFEKPMLFLAVMAVAPCMTNPELYSNSSREAIQEYANLSILGGDKSLELVQAMVAMVTWYCPIGKWSSMKFYEHVHLASTMAMEIGLGQPEQTSNRLSADNFFLGQGNSSQFGSSKDQSNEIERQRTLLSCYLNCVAVSLALRRPNLLQFTPYMIKCVQNIEAFSPLPQSDRRLIAYVKLLNIAEEISATYALPSGSRSMIVPDTYNNRTINHYMVRLEAWRRSCDVDTLDVSCKLMVDYVTILLHEPGLHQFYPPNLFKPPYIMDPPETSVGSNIHTPFLIQAVASAHALCDRFGALDVGDIRSLPINLFNRTTYALVVLVKTALLDTVTSEVESTFFRDLTRVDWYLNLCINALMEASGMMEFWVPYGFGSGLIRLHKWYRYQLERAGSNRSMDPEFTIYAGPDIHPALAQNPGASDLLQPPPGGQQTIGNQIHSGEGPGIFIPQNPNNGFDINTNFSDWPVDYTQMQSWDVNQNFDFATEFLSMQNDMDSINSSAKYPFDLDSSIGGVFYDFDTLTTTGEMEGAPP